MIILNKLTWNNCFSYTSDNELTLDDSVLTQIVGTNGAGKSSIPIIIEEVLYNKNSKGIKKTDIPNRNTGQGSYNIDLIFTIDSDEYKISVARNKTLKIKLLKNKEDISSHTATNTFKTIEEILGMDFKTFTQLIYQNTNSSLQFLTATDTTRKRFLIDLLDLNKYVEYFEVFKKLVKDFNTKIAVAESKVETINRWLLDNNLEGMKVLPIQKIEINLENDEKLLGSLQTEFENISEKNKKISKNNHYRTQLSKIDPSKFPIIDISSIQSYDKETERRGELLADKKAAETAINKINKLGNQCPTCEQTIEESFKQKFLESYKDTVDQAKKELEKLEEKINRIKEKNSKLKERQKLEQEFENLLKAVDNNIPTELIDEDKLKEDIEKAREILIKKRKTLEEQIKENQLRERNNTKISIIKEQTEDKVKELDIIVKDLEKLKTEYNNLEVLKKTFSTNGLLAYKIEYLVKELETLVNEYLSDLSDGKFTLTFAITNDKLNVLITDNGVEVDILSLSSGELARVTTATLLAIRKLMNSISKSRINVLFLDEVIAVLDDIGREKLVDVLIKEDKLNTFIVSHEWTHPLLNKLNIVKENNISRIDNG